MPGARPEDIEGSARLAAQPDGAGLLVGHRPLRRPLPRPLAAFLERLQMAGEAAADDEERVELARRSPEEVVVVPADHRQPARAEQLQRAGLAVVLREY